MKGGILSRWLHRPAPAEVNPGRQLAMIRVNKDRALIRKTAREMRERLGLPPHPLLDR